jgi:SAM-dependent methyltransferase
MTASAVASLDALHEACSESAGRFRAEHDEQVGAYRRLISDGIDGALAALRGELAELTGGNESVRELGEQIEAYVGWMQWSLWDLPVLAVALEPDPDEFRDVVAACGLAYIAIRAFDDVIDEHYAYKGRRETLLGAVSEGYADARRARRLSILAALLLCFDGLGRLAARTGPHAQATLDGTIGSLRRAVVGAMMEAASGERWSHDDYVRMVRLKNVDYWRALYAAVDPDRRSPLYPFLEGYYEVAQYLNDVEDHDDDVRRGQPNLVALAAANGTNGLRPVDEPRPWAVTEALEELLAARILDLGAAAADLPQPERAVAQTKLADLLDDARSLGLFADQRREEAPLGNGRRPLALFPYSDLADVLEQAGRDALVEVGCGACGARDRRELFGKQGFRFHRCRACSHIYVSPRVRTALQEELIEAFDGAGSADKYLEVQRIYAERICDLLRRRTPGARLLDVGFGRGYLLQMAQVYGFDVFGLDGSAERVAALQPLFGQRVARAVLGRDRVPWDSFDVVVLSHVLEHVAEPREALAEIASSMNAGGWLYVTVPDAASLEFRIFGKHWDAVNPLVHLHYFTAESLERLLRASGFEEVRRIRQPQVREELAPRWMRLMRQLGGTESSELILLARLPDDPAHYPIDDES